MVLYSKFSVFRLPISSLNMNRPDRYSFLNHPCIWLSITHSLRIGLFIYEVFHTTRNVNSQGNARSCTHGDDGGEKSNNVARSWQDGWNVRGSTSRSRAGKKRANEMEMQEKMRTGEEQDPRIEKKNVKESKWVSGIQLRLCHHLQEEPILGLSPLIAQMPGLPQLPGWASLQKQSPFIRLPAMSTWVPPLESVHHQEVWMCLRSSEKHKRPAASVHISEHMHHCECFGGFRFCFFIHLAVKEQAKLSASSQMVNS